MMSEDNKRLVDGALAGLIATVPMTLFMLASHRNLPFWQRYPLPPSLITQRAFGDIALPGHPAPIPNIAATLAAHFGFGGVTGALFAAAPSALRRQYPVATGVVYGLCVWAASYLGWVPGLSLMPPATHQPAARNTMMIAAHVVWGATLGLALELLSERRAHRSSGRPHDDRTSASRSLRASRHPPSRATCMP